MKKGQRPIGEDLSHLNPSAAMAVFGSSDVPSGTYFKTNCVPKEWGPRDVTKTIGLPAGPLNSIEHSAVLDYYPRDPLISSASTREIVEHMRKHDVPNKLRGQIFGWLDSIPGVTTAGYREDAIGPDYSSWVEHYSTPSHVGICFVCIISPAGKPSFLMERLVESVREA